VCEKLPPSPVLKGLKGNICSVYHTALWCNFTSFCPILIGRPKVIIKIFVEKLCRKLESKNIPFSPKIDDDFIFQLKMQEMDKSLMKLHL